MTVRRRSWRMLNSGSSRRKSPKRFATTPPSIGGSDINQKRTSGGSYVVCCDVMAIPRTNRKRLPSSLLSRQKH